MRILVFLFLLPLSFICAQESTAEISGRILDQSLSEPLAYIRIELKDLNDHLMAETLSDEKGVFHLKNLSNGTYVLQVSMSGFKTYSQRIDLFDKRIVLKDIFLKINASDEVVKTAERTTIINKIDRKVVNVGKDLISAGTSAADVLNNIPSVSVDQQTGALSLRGDSNASVLVDGKPSNIPIDQLLKQLSSDAIDKVELITAPSSKYNPEGTSGIINIILKKGKKKGYHINFNNGLRSRKYMSYNTSINANLNTGKFNFFTNYGYNKGRSQYKTSGERLDQNQSYESVSTSINESHFIKAGFDYFINEKNEFTFSSTYNILPGNEVNVKSFTLDKYAGDRKNQLQRRKTNSYDQEYGLNFKHSFDKEEHELILEATYSRNKNSEHRIIDFPDNEENLQNKRERWQVQLDYTLPLSKDAKLEGGLQYRRNGFNNDYRSNLLTASGFDFSRDIYSGYLSYASKWKSWGLQLGLRGEQVQRNMNFLNDFPRRKRYFSLYPSTHITYDINDKKQFSLNFSRRISRPHPYQLNPVRRFQWQNTAYVGNPDLNSQYTNSIEWNYMYRFKKGDLTTGLFYRHTRDAMNQVFEKNDDPNTLVITYGNYGKEQSYGMDINGTYKPFSWWSINGGFQFYRLYLSGFQNLGAQRISQWSLHTRNEFKLMKGLSLQLFTLYYPSRKNLQGSLNSFFLATAAMRVSVFQGKGDLTLRLSDIFNTFRFRYQLNQPYRQTVDSSPLCSPEISVGFSYNIGGKIRKREVKSFDSGEGKTIPGPGIGL